MTFKGILDVFMYCILRIKYTLNLSYNMHLVVLSTHLHAFFWECRLSTVL